MSGHPLPVPAGPPPEYNKVAQAANDVISFYKEVERIQEQTGLNQEDAEMMLNQRLMGIIGTVITDKDGNIKEIGRCCSRKEVLEAVEENKTESGSLLYGKTTLTIGKSPDNKGYDYIIRDWHANGHAEVVSSGTIDRIIDPEGCFGK